MKTEVSSMELKHLVTELRSLLVGGRIEKIYQPAPATFLFAIRKVGENKRLLRIELPKYFYITSQKEEMPEKLSGFCGYLRKYIEGTRIVALEQPMLERAIRMHVETSESVFVLCLELFGKGNLVVCEPDGTIVQCLEQVVFKDRVVKPGAMYSLPPRQYVLDAPLKERFAELLTASVHANIAVTLAVDIGLGGLFAKELCARAGISVGKKQSTPDEIDKLFAALQNIMNQKTQPLLVLKNDLPEEVLAFPMKTFENAITQPLKSLSEGLDKLFLATQERAPVKEDVRLRKLNAIIMLQEQNAILLKQKAAEEQKKGEFMYEHYQEVKAVLDEIQIEMKHHSLQELQQKYKEHKHIKEIAPAKGMVVVEV